MFKTEQTDKIILNSISGEFRSKELTAIIGLSGCGKSSLLNVLSGYETKNVSGTVELNGAECQDSIQQYSSYIMQESNFHKFITVKETLMFTLNCKAIDIDKNAKNEKVHVYVFFSSFSKFVKIKFLSSSRLRISYILSTDT